MASYPRVLLSAMFAGMIFAYVDVPKLRLWDMMLLEEQLTLISFNLVVLGFVIAFAAKEPYLGLPPSVFGIMISIVLYLS